MRETWIALIVSAQVRSTPTLGTPEHRRRAPPARSQQLEDLHRVPLQRQTGTPSGGAALDMTRKALRSRVATGSSA